MTTAGRSGRGRTRRGQTKRRSPILRRFPCITRFFPHISGIGTFSYLRDAQDGVGRCLGHALHACETESGMAVGWRVVRGEDQAVQGRRIWAEKSMFEERNMKGIAGTEPRPSAW